MAGTTARRPGVGRRRGAPYRPLGDHIVAGRARVAAPARHVLARFNIGINDAVNGAFLPANRAAQAASGGAYHPTLHTNRYYEAVNKALEPATTRAQAIDALKDIGARLLNNTFPK